MDKAKEKRGVNSMDGAGDGGLSCGKAPTANTIEVRRVEISRWRLRLTNGLEKAVRGI